MGEIERLSGWRKVGRIYISGQIVTHAATMELPQVCPTCNAGVKAARGLSRFSGALLRGPVSSVKGMSRAETTADGFITWAGIRFYKTKEAYITEAQKYGASVVLNAVPHGLEIGSVVHVAHAKGVTRTSRDMSIDHDLPPETKFNFPAIICSFKVESIEMVCRGWQSEDELLMHSLDRRGIDVVFVNDDKKFEPPKRASGVLRDQ